MAGIGFSTNKKVMKAKIKHVVKPIGGMPHHYIVISSDGRTEYLVSLIDRGGRGSCKCKGYLNHVLNERSECCSHISDAREYEMSLPAFDPALMAAVASQSELVECDACGQTKPIEEFLGAGHLPGGQYICGADIDSSVCNQCAEKFSSSDPAW